MPSSWRWRWLVLMMAKFQGGSHQGVSAVSSEERSERERG